eukprot:TRINITY_DN871_c0_g1_i1.p1 TRINITY_DN871_c0_g1~~TRINITY_DN871_c0_g1_i1.p1  ORF type:complete len:282 (-),score=68.83 TRINITY_DN871_c0_g1_i1:74-802(-)
MNNQFEYVSSEWIPTGQKLYALSNEKSTKKVQSGFSIVLVHGADKDLQNANYWKEHLDWMGKMGTVYAMDMLGHGKSTATGEYSKTFTDEEQVSHLVHFIREKIDISSRLVLVGRSWGGSIVLQTAKKLVTEIHPSFPPSDIVLIAPAVDPKELMLPQEIGKSTPVLLFWAEDDAIVSYERRMEILEHLHHTQLISFGTILTSNDIPKWKSHCGEMVHKEVFQREFTRFILSKYEDKILSSQ